MRAFIPASPFAQELGIELVDLRRDHAELRLPWAPRLATLGDIVHGGAIAALLDTAGMAAAWSDDVVPEKPAGATVSMNGLLRRRRGGERPDRARVRRAPRAQPVLLRGHRVGRRGERRRPRLDGPPIRLSSLHADTRAQTPSRSRNPHSSRAARARRAPRSRRG